MKKLSVTFLIVLLIACNTPGNIGSISIVESNLQTKVLLTITDSIQKDGILALPKDYENLFDFDDYDHLVYRIYYFDKFPQEAFMVTFNGAETVRYVYSFEKKEWLSRESNISVKERNRIKNRFINEVLHLVEKKANEFNYSKNDIYVDIDNCDFSIICGDR